MGGSDGSKVLAETAELLGVSVYCVRVGAEGVRPRDEETNEDDEEPDCIDCNDLFEAMARAEGIGGGGKLGRSRKSAFQHSEP